MLQSIAYLLVRDLPAYRRDAFASGLQSLGYAIITKPPQFPRPSDVLIIWNRYGPNHIIARRFEDMKAPVIVAENGYVDMVDTKKAFALALGHHNGAGRWPIGDQWRAHTLVQTIRPWRGDGSRDDILILPQRGVGPPGVAMPRGWVADVQQRLKAVCGRRRVRLRPHPGTQKHVRPLFEDLDGVGACVVWGSGAGVKALMYGVPVVHEFPRWIGALGGSFGLSTLTAPRLGDRAAMAEAVSWAQWSLEEVIAGVPFQYLLALHAAKMEKRRA
jgi:hypothetical protein